MTCEYGCGQEAQYILKNGKHCCSKNCASCPIIRRKISEKLKGKKFSKQHKKNISKSRKGKFTGSNNPNYENHPSPETRELMGIKNRGKTTWNKGKTGVYSEEVLIKFRASRIKKIKEKSSNWKGGYFSDNIPQYDKCAHLLTIEEDSQRDKIDHNILTVICTYSNCKKRFIPKLTSVYERVRALNGKQYGDQRLYCSEKCKKLCPIYGQKNYPKSYKKELYYTSEELNTWKVQVKELDNNQCQMCGSTKNIHVHHIIPVKLEPFFALDPVNGICLCEECHYRISHKIGTECSTGELANIICKGEKIS